MLHNVGYSSCDPENRYQFECQVEKDNTEESFHPVTSELDKNVVLLLINYIVQISNHFFCCTTLSLPVVEDIQPCLDAF